MKKLNVPEEDEAYALIEATARLIERFLDDFVEYGTSKGCVATRKESRHFAVTIQLERKKEAKP